jgi:hypothetical protein
MSDMHDHFEFEVEEIPTTLQELAQSLLEGLVTEPNHTFIESMLLVALRAFIRGE